MIEKIKRLSPAAKNLLALAKNRRYIPIFILIFLVLVLAVVAFFSTRRPPPAGVIVEDLTQEEEQLPDAKPQPFQNPQSIAKGGLVVTSEVKGMRVMIDLSEEETPANDRVFPVQIPPFKILGIPAGRHYLWGYEENHEEVDLEFVIEDDKITKIHLTPKPIENKESY